LEHLFQHAADHRRWKIAAANKMNVYSPGGGKKFKPCSTSSLAVPHFEPATHPKADKEVTFNFPKVSTLSLSKSFKASKRHKRVESKRSFRRTRSKLFLLYNQVSIS
jgi:hypothetical protein